MIGIRLRSRTARLQGLERPGRQGLRHSGAAALLTWILTSCSTTGAVEGGAHCTFGETIPCATDAACLATRTCLPDLSSYGPCRCEEEESDAESSTQVRDGGS
jgi:hypothetical protein